MVGTVRAVHEVSITEIRNLNLKQGIIERLFGLGSVEIASAGTAGIGSQRGAAIGARCSASITSGRMGSTAAC